MAKILIPLSILVLSLSSCSLVLLSTVALLSNGRCEISNSILTETPPPMPISNPTPAVKK
ncbi:MAG: hypothetical protein LBV62_01955 [Rickettsiales bacterium]|jgi:hypothetical protein|nr:hypothetical protein [Rickettsiales bacterium]